MRTVSISYRLPGLIEYTVQTFAEVTPDDAAALTQAMRGERVRIFGFSVSDTVPEPTYFWYTERTQP